MFSHEKKWTKLILSGVLVFVLAAESSWAFITRPSVAFKNRQTATTLESSANEPEQSSSTSSSSMEGKTVYQRSFFRVSANDYNTDILDEPRTMVIEERLRYQVKDQPDFVEPVGPRTIVLRDGDVDDGKIGDVIATLHMRSSNGGDHTGVVKSWESTYATALYLACNPDKYLMGKLLQLGSAQDFDLGLSSVLACIGARNLQDKKNPIAPPAAETELTASDEEAESTDATSGDDLEEDILTLPSDSMNILPREVTELTLSDGSDMAENVQWMANNLKMAKILGSSASADAKVMIQENLDWNVRRTSRSATTKEYNTIVASDLTFTYPEAKELARTVANALEPSEPYFVSTSGRGQPVPKFLYVCDEDRENFTFLRKFLEKGYRMTVVDDMFEMESIRFVIQTIDTAENGAQEEAALDELTLEVQEMYDTEYHLMTAVHHPDYRGGGSGEFFFPMETGEYDDASGGTYLERDPGFDQGGGGGGWLGQ